MNVLLTGSTGMVGLNIINNPSFKKFNILSPSRSELDLLEPKSLKTFFKKNQIDFVIHAAGLVGGIQANIESPYSYLVDNSQIGMNLINVCLDSNIKNFLNMGSSCMYPKNFLKPLHESDLLQGPLEPTNEGYALAKIMVAKLCEYITNNSDYFEYKTVIPCNLYGAYDNFSYETSHMIPAVIRKIHDAKIHNSKTVEIWGDGNARREFMSARDLSNFIYYALENFINMPQNINVGLGFDYSINEYYEIIGKKLGFEGEFIHNLDKPIGMKRKLLNIESLELFGWKHGIGLEDGIEESYKFFLEHYVN